MNQTIRFQAETLFSQIAVASSVIAPKNVLPILSNLRLETKEHANGGVYLEIMASDGDTWFVTKCDNIEADKGISLCVDAKDLVQAIRNLGGKYVEMRIDTDKHSIVCVYDKGRLSLPFEDTENYPMPIDANHEEMPNITIAPKQLVLAIEKAGFATANDELRPVMNGIHFDFKNDGMYAVATDGYKLTKYVDTAITYTHGDGQSDVVGFTLPDKPSNILLKVLNNQTDDVSVHFNGKIATFESNTFYLITRLVEARYPNYDSVIPKEQPIEVVINKDAFVSALKRVVPMSGVSSNLVILHFENNEMEVSAEDYDLSKQASEKVECDYSIDPFAIGFKGSILSQVLSYISGDTVKIALSNESKPGLLYETTPNDKGYEYMSLIMPMRLNK